YVHRPACQVCPIQIKQLLDPLGRQSGLSREPQGLVPHCTPRSAPKPSHTWNDDDFLSTKQLPGRHRLIVVVEINVAADMVDPLDLGKPGSMVQPGAAVH